ncbi:MAG: hypothetical protein LBF02_02205 [Mycoplasmataceae bacterium]|jgi:hypothetical protein|nr:hypothetical protein [Mycoplasmataceae bacterium]
MIFNNNQSNNTNKLENSKKLESIIKKMGKKINFHIDGCSDGKTNVGLDFYTTQFIYSKSTPLPPPPEPTIIEEILKSIKLINVKLDKMDTKIDDMDKRITNIELVQKIQGEKLDRLENKLDTVIILNNLKTE